MLVDSIMKRLASRKPPLGVLLLNQMKISYQVQVPKAPGIKPEESVIHDMMISGAMKSVKKQIKQYPIVTIDNDDALDHYYKKIVFNLNSGEEMKIANCFLYTLTKFESKLINAICYNILMFLLAGLSPEKSFKNMGFKVIYPSIKFDGSLSWKEMVSKISETYPAPIDMEWVQGEYYITLALAEAEKLNITSINLVDVLKPIFKL